MGVSDQNMIRPQKIYWLGPWKWRSPEICLSILEGTPVEYHFPVETCNRYLLHEINPFGSFSDSKQVNVYLIMK